jgi:hypothetical protein
VHRHLRSQKLFVFEVYSTRNTALFGSCRAGWKERFESYQIRIVLLVEILTFNKVVCVTGASGAIGAEIVRSVLSQGILLNCFLLLPSAT